LIRAAKSGDIDALKIALGKGADSYENAIYIACKEGHLEIGDLLEKVERTKSEGGNCSVQ